MELTEQSSKMTTFWTPFGRYRFVRMPFGIAPAMEIYQRRMNELVSGLEGVEIMADDILVYGKGENNEQALEDHNKNLENLLIRVKESNLTLNKDKVRLCQQSVQYFGHLLTCDKLSFKIHSEFGKRNRATTQGHTPRYGILLER